jgi:hypothetical protein
LRTVVPTLDRDLETICALLEREPQARYRAASDLAADLERWLEGRPIIARRVCRQSTGADRSHPKPRDAADALPPAARSASSPGETPVRLTRLPLKALLAVEASCDRTPSRGASDGIWQKYRRSRRLKTISIPLATRCRKAYPDHRATAQPGPGRRAKLAMPSRLWLIKLRRFCLAERTSA